LSCDKKVCEMALHYKEKVVDLGYCKGFLDLNC